MAIEIKELVIRAAVQRQEEDACAEAGAEKDSPHQGSGVSVAACVKEVLQILKRSKER